MPLRDHFHDPLKSFCPWHSFHGNWATKMVDRLNGEVLSDRHQAFGTRNLGVQAEVDVGTFERDERGSLFAGVNGHADGGGVATATDVYAPPAPPLTAAVTFGSPELFEVKVYRGTGGWRLVAAVELVSEANKDREDERRAFAVKCGSYLQQGVSLVVVDVVTNLSGDLHNDLCDVLDLPDPVRWTSPTGLHVAAYRAVKTGPPKQGDAARFDGWPHPLAVGEPFPTVPLWLAPDLAVPLELELTYEAACKSLRVR
ncbi:MAG: hypothetical protein K2X82_26315 [Gemmataceae bacterium]|nr:hypothetical protein [Gemmataceae bacterium]